MYASNNAFLATVARMRLAVPGRSFTFIAESQRLTQFIARHGTLRGGNDPGSERVVAESRALILMLSITVESADTQNALLPLVFALHAELNAYVDGAGYNRN
ncbi:hypothetical protein MN608_03146 [Microdochium nivale]|nr:hypothetical protein MN608_03146 [Microdochium nivale]